MAQFKVTIDREITMYQTIDLFIEAASPEEAESKAEAIIADGDDIPWDDLEEESVDDGKPDWEVVEVKPVGEPAAPATPPDMTFEAFTATRTYHEDMRPVMPDYTFAEDRPAPGYVYCGTLVIEEVTADWPQGSREAGKFYLLLGTQEYISNVLSDLERILYEYAESEGFPRK